MKVAFLSVGNVELRKLLGPGSRFMTPSALGDHLVEIASPWQLVLKDGKYAYAAQVRVVEALR